MSRLEWVADGPDAQVTTDGEFRAEASRYSKMTVWRLFRKIDGTWHPQPVNEINAYRLPTVKREALRLKNAQQSSSRGGR